MKARMPKGKTPSLIGSTLGRPKRIEVERRSTCARCGSAIVVGAVCYGIPRLGSGFSSPGRYCQDCYVRILDQTEKDLQELRSI
jgi:hypothetical protein